MKLGILADIHEDLDSLSLALECLRREAVDRVVVLGDVCETGRRLGPTVALLQRATGVGVWGDHDLGFCHEPTPEIRRRYGPAVLGYMATLRPSLEIEDCLFTHGLPIWDPTDPAIYYLGERPEAPAGRTSCFAASTHRLLLMGHFHRWLVANSGGVLPWTGEGPIMLPAGERFLIVVAAVCEGWCAVLDTTTQRLTPHRLPGPDVLSGGVR